MGGRFKLQWPWHRKVWKGWIQIGREGVFKKMAS
jgi:hypothetical protein